MKIANLKGTLLQNFWHAKIQDTFETVLFKFGSL